MNQLSSSTGDKRHTAKEPTDLEATEVVTEPGSAASPAVSQLARSLVMVRV